MNTIEFLDAVKAKRGVASDYALAKVLGVSQPTVVGYRSGRRIFDDEVALSIAQILGLHPIQVIAQANAERAKTPEQRARWMDVLQGFLSLLPHAKFVERRLVPR